MKVFPNAKVLLTVRNSDTWHDSVKNSIYQFNKLRETSWTVSMFYKITGASSTMEVVRDVANHVPQGFETGTKFIINLQFCVALFTQGQIESQF